MGCYLMVIIWVCYGYHLESDRERLDTASSLARGSRAILSFTKQETPSESLAKRIDLYTLAISF